MRRALAVVAVAALVIVAAVDAGAPSNDPLVWTLDTHHTAQPVDFLTWCGDCVFTDYTTQEPWVVNPRTNYPYDLPAVPGPSREPGCMWDTDDSYSYVSSGNVLVPGASPSVTECRYSGDLGNEPFLLTDVSVRSPSPDLLVTETWTWETTAGTASVTAMIPPTWEQATHSWRYFDCVRSPQPQGGVWIDIPGSHGGRAIGQLIVVTVTNPTTRKVTKTGGVVDSGIIYGSMRGCSTWHLP